MEMVFVENKEFARIQNRIVRDSKFESCVKRVAQVPASKLIGRFERFRVSIEFDSVTGGSEKASISLTTTPTGWAADPPGELPNLYCPDIDNSYLVGRIDDVQTSIRAVGARRPFMRGARITRF